MLTTKRVYLDNAATTPIDERVVEAMTQMMKSTYGNPSASHSIGRKAKAALETARKNIAKMIHADSREIIFTSGGTEADNMAIRCSVHDLGVKNIITSPIEHKAVLETSREMERDGLAKVHLVNVDSDGRVDLDHLEQLASQYKGALISLMHANNEVGTLLDYRKVSKIAKENDCLFHSDTVQTMGHYSFDVTEFGADFLTCSAHKLHGPKGVGFLYVNKNLNLRSMITGGGQESNHRAGTENLVGIVGLETALQLAFEQLPKEQKHIYEIKEYMIQELQKNIPGVDFNGDVSFEGGLYTVLNCSLPPQENNSLILFQLDIEGVCCSGGSACNSGANKGSHVLEAMEKPADRQAVRFSFGRYSSKYDVDFAIKALRKLIKAEPIVA